MEKTISNGSSSFTSIIVGKISENKTRGALCMHRTLAGRRVNRFWTRASYATAREVRSLRWVRMAIINTRAIIYTRMYNSFITTRNCVFFLGFCLASAKLHCLSSTFVSALHPYLHSVCSALAAASSSRLTSTPVYVTIHMCYDLWFMTTYDSYR
jgi:hypothetical protein